MVFRRGDEVEVSSKEDGFVGSYFPAKIISELMKKEYIVQYKTLLREDMSGLLREIVAADEVRPVPPEVSASGFSLCDEVDVYANDGWWAGKVTGKVGGKYFVYFETTGDEIAYPLSNLRVHQEYVNSKWVSSSFRNGALR
ncbi:hypothetical protein RJ639_013929 [Escallonia herrerae]|uniref:Agenet domain-containing protein n=1 Tax=Escallonia herrerae TaxID=1293975 RepID=A0AA89ALD4_9ASTE|nr:hypothetical protein RJ639_013929 [Escallonia herrerae]